MAGSVADGPGIAHAIADIGGRLEMEDEHVLEVGSEGPLRVLGAVFDGHGGSAVARLAARRFPALFRDALAGGPEAALRAALAGVHREAEGLRGGAAAATFYVDGPLVTVANAGDAHVVTVSGDTAVRLTEEHRITNEAELHRGVAAGGAKLGAGDGPPPGARRPVARPHPVPPWVLVAAGDGLWDVVTAEELPGVLRDAVSAEEAANRIAHEALHVRRTGDNLTVLAVRLP